MQSNDSPVMGQWTNAPLVFVLAQVRFVPSQQVSLDAMREAAVAALGSNFPHINPVMSLDLHIDLNNLPAKPPVPIVGGYDFLRADLQAMARITSDSISFAVSKYANYREFETTWLSICAILSSLGIYEVSRQGMRYVDFVFPEDGKVPEDYVRPPFDPRVSPPLSGALGHAGLSGVMMDYPFPDGRLRVQYSRGYGDPALPLDLQGMLPPAPIAGMRRSTTISLSGVIDTDRWIEGRFSASESDLRVSFRRIHNELSAAFVSIVTPDALAYWNQPSNG